MRLLALFATLLIALAVVAGGIGMFIKIGADQRDIADKMQRIQAGEVQPQTLTVVRKYVESHHRAPADYRVVFHSPTHDEVSKFTSKSFYSAAHPGQKVTGYRFSDGYVIPESRDPPSKVTAFARWIFLICGLIGAAVVFIVALVRFMKPPGPGLASVWELIHGRMNQSSDL